jgi:formyltetrahydrofolate hydrolase
MFDAKFANCNRNRALDLIDEDRVDHTHRPAELVAAGCDAECLALARAVRWHGQHRILLNGPRTAVFS